MSVQCGHCAAVIVEADGTPTRALRDALGDSVEAVLDADGLYVLRSRRFRVEVVP